MVQGLQGWVARRGGRSPRLEHTAQQARNPLPNWSLGSCRLVQLVPLPSRNEAHTVLGENPSPWSPLVTSLTSPVPVS